MILVDEFCEIIAGDIDHDDYQYVDGTRFEFKPYRTYYDCLEEFNQSNNYDWGVWNDKKLNWTPKDPSIEWLVSTQDCTDLTIAPNPAEVGLTTKKVLETL